MKMNRLIKMMIRRTIVFTVLLFLVSTALYSMQDSLNSYMRYAVRNNPAVLQKYTEYRAALEKIPQAAGLPDPELDLSYYLMPMELINGRQIANASLMQMFPWFGVLKNAKDEMSNMALAKLEEYREESLRVLYDVESTWYDLYRIRKSVGLTGRNIEILQGIEEIALIRYKTAAGISGNSPSQSRRQSTPTPAQGGSSSGMPGMQTNSSGTVNQPRSQQQMPMQDPRMGASGGSGLSDLYRIRMEAAELENNIASLLDQEKTIIARFNLLLDRKSNHPVVTADTLSADTLSIDITAAADAFGNNPMLGMIMFEKKSYEAREQMTKKMGYPMVGLGIGYSLIGKTTMAESSMNGADMIMPMVSVSLPVWRKKYRAMREEATLMAESADFRYRNASNELLAEHHEIVRQYNDALRRIDLNRRQHELASNTLDLLLTSYSVSSAGLTDILRVRQQLLDYEMRELESVTDFNKAVASLKRLLATNLDYANFKK
jgi:outer membrane protein TolC